MSITLYSKFRRQGFRRAWHFAGMTEWCASVGAYIAVFLAALLLAQYIADTAIAADEAEHKAQAANHKVGQLEETWLSCLNNKGLWINDRLHVCSVADTHIRQGEFLK